MTGVFADSFFFFALVNPRDEAHQRARDLAQRQTGLIYTTAWVFTELADGLSSPGDREVYLRIARRFREDPSCIWVPPMLQWFERGSTLYEQRPDREWSLTDCISFEVMQEYGLTDALTGDHHFQQAGFTALLG